MKVLELEQVAVRKNGCPVVVCPSCHHRVEIGKRDHRMRSHFGRPVKGVASECDMTHAQVLLPGDGPSAV